jgi:hypothetical protein
MIFYFIKNEALMKYFSFYFLIINFNFIIIMKKCKSGSLTGAVAF